MARNSHEMAILLLLFVLIQTICFFMGTSSHVPMRSGGPDFPFDSGPIANHAIFIARPSSHRNKQTVLVRTLNFQISEKSRNKC